MDLVTIAKLGSLLRATIVDYTILHEKMTEVLAIEHELKNSTPDTYEKISKKYLMVIESYLIANSILKIQYKNLQDFAQGMKNKSLVRNQDITKAQLELLLLDIDHLKNLPSLRTAIESINEVLIASGALRDETLTMVGVLKDGEIRV